MSLFKAALLAVFVPLFTTTQALATSVCDVVVSDFLVGGSYELKVGSSVLESDTLIRNLETSFTSEAIIFNDHDSVVLSAEPIKLHVELVDVDIGESVWQQTENLTLILPETRTELAKLVGCAFEDFPHMKLVGTMISSGGDGTVGIAEMNLALVSVSENEDAVDYAVGTLSASFDVPHKGRIMHLKHTFYVELWSILD